jgi:hypothetical protein
MFKSNERIPKFSAGGAVKLCPQVGQATVCPAISAGASILCWQPGQLNVVVLIKSFLIEM